MGRTNRSRVDQAEDIPAKSVMLLVLVAFASIMIASAFVADWLLSVKAQRAETRQAIIQAAAVQGAPNSQPRIVGVPVTINPTREHK